VQAKHSNWTRADLMKNLAWSMGQEFAHLAPEARQELLEQMTGQALGVDFGVVCLRAPEWPRVPRSLIRDLDRAASTPGPASPNTQRAGNWRWKSACASRRNATAHPH